MQNKQINTTRTKNKSEREGDGRYALVIPSERSAKRWAKRDAEVAARRAELVAQYGDDACMYA